MKQLKSFCKKGLKSHFTLNQFLMRYFQCCLAMLSPIAISILYLTDIFMYLLQFFFTPPTESEYPSHSPLVVVS